MKTGFDLVDIIWKALKAGLGSELTGGIYKFRRPAGSLLEDIVVNSLSVPSGQVQNAILNVNVYAPNVKTMTGGVADSQPNTKRLKEITDLVIAAIGETYGPGYSYWVQQQNFLEDLGTFFSNVRVEFVQVNVN